MWKIYIIVAIVVFLLLYLAFGMIAIGTKSCDTSNISIMRCVMADNIRVYEVEGLNENECTAYYLNGEIFMNSYNFNNQFVFTFYYEMCRGINKHKVYDDVLKNSLQFLQCYTEAGLKTLVFRPEVAVC